MPLALSRKERERLEYVLNTTADYHRNKLDSLGWELTMCNCLDPPDSPCRRLLARKDTYGKLLYSFLEEITGFDEIEKILEVGGGYGYLMRDFLGANPRIQAAMLDISPFLLDRQRDTLAEALREGRVRFFEQDFLQVDPGFLASFDLVIMNENLGDFPTLAGIKRKFFYSPWKDLDGNLAAARELFLKYNLDIPESCPFNLNAGALQAVEILCSSGAARIFLSEHSCEAGAHARAPGAFPERIRLKGHDEYTVKFSFLERIAACHGYSVRRGPMADYLEVDTAMEIRSAAGDDEAARHFLEDIYKYEYLFLSKEA